MKMTTRKKLQAKRYWPDGASARAKCPKCSLLGTRTMSRNGRLWTFNHGAVPGILGLPEGRYCFVPVAPTAGETSSPNKVISH